MNLHPKTTAAGAGGAVGVLLVAVLQLAGVEIPPQLAGAISALLSTLLAYLTPSPNPPADPPSAPEDPPGAPIQTVGSVTNGKAR